jgi:hypothetical protein
MLGVAEQVLQLLAAGERVDSKFQEMRSSADRSAGRLGALAN